MKYMEEINGIKIVNYNVKRGLCKDLIVCLWKI